MSFHKEYQESIDLINKLERILELKRRESSFKSKKTESKIKKEKKGLEDILENSKDELSKEEEPVVSTEELGKHQELVEDLISNKDNLSENQIQQRLESIAEEAPEGWEPTDQLRDFYKDISNNNGASTDLSTVASLFLGVDKSKIEMVRDMKR